MPNSDAVDVPSARLRVFADAVVAEADLPEPECEVKTTIFPRRVYIRKHVELAKYGYIDGCAGCHKASRGVAGGVHSEACRSKIEKAMKEDPDLQTRVEASSERITQAIADELMEADKRRG